MSPCYAVQIKAWSASRVHEARNGLRGCKPLGCPASSLVPVLWHLGLACRSLYELSLCRRPRRGVSSLLHRVSRRWQLRFVAENVSPATDLGYTGHISTWHLWGNSVVADTEGLLAAVRSYFVKQQKVPLCSQSISLRTVPEGCDTVLYSLCGW